MPFVFKRLALIMSIAAAFAADNPPFRAAPAASYANHQKQGAVTIGVEPYHSGDKVKTAFGKLDPYQYGILPVLVVIQNDGDKSVDLKSLTATYIGSRQPACRRNACQGGSLPQRSRPAKDDSHADRRNWRRQG